MTDLALHQISRTRTNRTAAPTVRNTSPAARTPLARTSPEQVADHPTTVVPAPEPTATQATKWDLVVRAQAGGHDGREAFGKIYDQNIKMVFQFVYFRVGNQQMAEDITADTFERALKRIHTVTWQGRDIGAWLVTIARNLVADYYKSGRYRYESVAPGHDLSEAVADTAERRPGHPGDPADAAVDHLANVTLYKAIAGLTAEQRDAVVLRYIQGVSVSETAQIMDKDPGAIKALTYRAVRTLARILPDGFNHHTN